MKEIFKDVYHVGDSGCSVFLVDSNSEDGLILIDCGMSLSLIKRINKYGLNPLDIKHCILTHFHIDHIGACSDLKNFNKNVKFYAHYMDAIAIEEEGHDHKTAALWYGVDYRPVKLEKRLKGDIEILKFGEYDFQCIHTPGQHKPEIFFNKNSITKTVFPGVSERIRTLEPFVHHLPVKQACIHHRHEVCRTPPGKSIPCIE